MGGGLRGGAGGGGAGGLLINCAAVLASSSRVGFGILVPIIVPSYRIITNMFQNESLVQDDCFSRAN